MLLCTSRQDNMKCPSMIATTIEQRSKTVRSHRSCDASRTAWVLMLMTLSYFHGCATLAQVTPALPNRDATIGKTKGCLLACAGQPIREAVTDRYASFLYKAIRLSVGEAKAGKSFVGEKMDPGGSQSRLIAFVLRQSYAFSVPSSRRIV